MSYEDAVSRRFPVTDEEKLRAYGAGDGFDVATRHGQQEYESMSADRSTFERELEQLINRHSVENQSATPDFILAQYLRGCLEAWTVASLARDKWYGIERWPNRDCELGAPHD
jgi:hypothetical protein